VRDDLASILAIDPTVECNISNYSEPQPSDARSALLNLGIRRSSGRYLAFLDHDDVIYPETYRNLVNELILSRCALSFGSIVMKDAEIFQDALLVGSRRASFVGSNLIDLFANNFCPVHSFVLDRSMVHAKDLWFDESLSKLEDYDFLLRLCAQYQSSFSLIHTIVGDYYIKSDNSNTLSGGRKSKEWTADWNRSVMAIERRKGQCVLSLPVRRLLGYSSILPELTISNLLDRQARVSATSTGAPLEPAAEAS
jgi:glycosyltransferase involved in cell wall biosynthesis